MELIDTKEERNAQEAAAIGEASRDDKKNCKIKTQKTKNIRKTLHVNILTF